jgi:hypothetical protein
MQYIKCLDYLEAIKHYAIEQFELRTLRTEHPIFAAASDAAYTDNVVTRQSIKGSISFLAICRYNQLAKQEASYYYYICDSSGCHATMRPRYRLCHLIPVMYI